MTSAACAQLVALMNDVQPDDLTAQEIDALLAVLTAARTRVYSGLAPVVPLRTR